MIRRSAVLQRLNPLPKRLDDRQEDFKRLGPAVAKIRLPALSAILRVVGVIVRTHGFSWRSGDPGRVYGHG
jgi:hypothetical protein